MSNESTNISEANRLLQGIEAARLWSYFHKDWLLQLRVSLREQLPSEYHIFVESEAVLITPSGFSAATVLPDVSVATRPDSGDRATTATPRRGTTALIEAEEACEVETHYSLLIRRAPENRVVAAIELLSPSNKGFGNRFDQEQHLRKRDEFLAAGVNLLEIDALEQGDRRLPAALDDLAAFSRCAWTACHSKGRRRFHGWGWNASDPLPSIDWQIDDTTPALVDLEQSCLSAASFNDWPSLIGFE